MPGINERVNKSKEGWGERRHRDRARARVRGQDEETGARRPVCRGVSAFCGRQMTVAYLPEPAAILLRSELRRRLYARVRKKRKRKKKKKKERDATNTNSVRINRSLINVRENPEQGVMIKMREFGGRKKIARRDRKYTLRDWQKSQ